MGSYFINGEGLESEDDGFDDERHEDDLTDSGTP
jgi:hypothetical protein